MTTTLSEFKHMMPPEEYYKQVQLLKEHVQKLTSKMQPSPKEKREMEALEKRQAWVRWATDQKGPSALISFKTCDGKSIELIVPLMGSVAALKVLLHEKMCNSPFRTPIPFHEMRLIFGGQQLKDAYSMMYYNIHKESTIHLLKGEYDVARPFAEKDSLPKQIIYIRMESDEPFGLLMVLKGEILLIQKAIFEKTGIPIDYQRLVYGGRILDGSMTMEGCGIGKESEIKMLKVRGWAD